MPAASLVRSLDRHSEAVSLRAGAVSIGNFDGVHRGHAALIERLVSQAREVGGPAVVFTFDPHPAQLLNPAAVPPPLTWTDRKAELLGALGVDVMVAYPADLELLALTPDAFFQQMLVEKLAVRAIVEGPNFYFGCQRSGTIDYLRELTRQAGIVLEVVEPVQAEGVFVSSSRIRELIQAGQIRAADALLTQPYRVHGPVVRGAGRGARIGFATANIEPVGMVLPPLGVYAGRAWLSDASYVAAIHIGPNPTFGEERVKFEVHLVGYDQPLYGATLFVDFYDRLRGIQPFGDVAALQEQLRRDVETACRVAAQR